MSTSSNRFDVDRPYEELRRHCNRVRAGLATLDALATTAATWDTAADDTLSVHVAAMKSDDELDAALVVERLAALAWDRALFAVAEAALAIAGDATRAPHVELFGVIGVEQATQLGSAKAALVGRDLVTLGRRLVERDAAFAGLEAPLAELANATARLEAAEAAREHESDQRYAFTLAKAQLVRRIERLTDETRLALLRAFPGRVDLASEILDT